MVAWLMLAGFGLAALGAEAARRLAIAQSLLDLPGPRRSHAWPTPRGGGVGIVLALLVLGPVLGSVHAGDWTVLAPLLLALTMTAAIGAADDFRPLPAWPRLLVHFGSAVLAAGWLLGVPASSVSALAVVIWIVVLVGAINAWNFMDGIDTLAASQAMLVFAALAWMPGLALESDLWRGLSQVAAAGCAGFLLFNLPPARLFLGDVGSSALGLLVAVLLAYAVLDEGLSWPLALIIPSAFLADSSLTLLGRMIRRERWWQPHREHLYQWAVRAGSGHGVISASYSIWTVLAIIVAGLVQSAGLHASLLALFWVYLFAGIIWFAMTGTFRRRARRQSA